MNRLDNGNHQNTFKPGEPVEVTVPIYSYGSGQLLLHKGSKGIVLEVTNPEFVLVQYPNGQRISTSAQNLIRNWSSCAEQPGEFIEESLSRKISRIASKIAYLAGPNSRAIRELQSAIERVDNELSYRDVYRDIPSSEITNEFTEQDAEMYLDKINELINPKLELAGGVGRDTSQDDGHFNVVYNDNTLGLRIDRRGYIDVVEPF